MRPFTKRQTFLLELLHKAGEPVGVDELWSAVRSSQNIVPPHEIRDVVGVLDNLRDRGLVRVIPDNRGNLQGQYALTVAGQERMEVFCSTRYANMRRWAEDWAWRRAEQKSELHNSAMSGIEPASDTNQTPLPSSSGAKSMYSYLQVNRLVVFLSCLGVFALVSGCMIYSSLNEVEPGEIGIRTRFGKIIDPALTNDLYWVWPWEDLVVCSVQERITTYSRAATAADCAVTDDSQDLGFTLTVSWQPQPTSCSLLYEHYSHDPGLWPVVLETVIPDAFKAVTGRHDLRYIIRNREEIRREVTESLTERLAEKLRERNAELVGALRINQVTLDNLDYSDEFAAAIERTQLAEQAVFEAENRLREQEVAAQRAVVEAEAGQLAAIAQARGQALSELIKVEAELTRLANLVRLGVDPNIVYTWDRFAETWDGEMPRWVMGEGGAGILLPGDVAASGREISEDDILLLLNEVRSQRQEMEQQMAEAAQSQPSRVPREDE